MPIPQGIYDKNFYELVNAAARYGGYGSIAEYLRKAPDYWFNDEVWRTLFPLEARENPTRIFQQKIGNTYVPVTAVYLADEAETPLMTNEGFEMKTGEIPRMGNGYLYDAKAYEEARALSRIAGNDAALSAVLEAFFVDTNKLLRSIHTKRSFTALQVESTGRYVTTEANNAGGLVSFSIDMHPLDANKGLCGGWLATGGEGTKYAWTSASANPIGDLRDMWKYAWTHQKLSADPNANVFRMNNATWTALLNHPTTRAAVAMWKTGYLADATTAAAVPVMEGDMRAYLKASGLPDVEVDITFGFTKKLNAKQEIEAVSTAAFADNVVVLRRKGAMGTFQWKKVSNIFATASSPVYYADGGSIAIQEDIYSVQQGTKFSANSLCVPVPHSIESVLYLDTSQAAL